MSLNVILTFGLLCCCGCGSCLTWHHEQAVSDPLALQTTEGMRERVGGGGGRNKETGRVENR